jgi:hypothetical protein
MSFPRRDIISNDKKDISSAPEPSTPPPETNKNFSKITITFHKEDSKYDGKPLVKAKIPYKYTHKVREVDTNLSLINRIMTKIIYMTQDFVEYLGDIIKFDKDKIAFKTAYFIKRNHRKISNKLWHGWEEMKKIGRGFRMLKNDGKFFIRQQR